MLKVINGLILDEYKSTNNENIILSNGTILDTHTLKAYSVIDVKIPKKFNQDSYIYFNIKSNEFEQYNIEIPIENIDISNPSLCPVIKVTTDNSNIISFSYYILADLTFDNVQPGSAIKIKNNVTINDENLFIQGDTIQLNHNIIGLISIYVKDYGEIDTFLSVIDIDVNLNRIKLMDSSLNTRQCSIKYLSSL